MLKMITKIFKPLFLKSLIMSIKIFEATDKITWNTYYWYISDGLIFVDKDLIDLLDLEDYSKTIEEQLIEVLEENWYDFEWFKEEDDENYFDYLDYLSNL